MRKLLALAAGIFPSGFLIVTVNAGPNDSGSPQKGGKKTVEKSSPDVQVINRVGWDGATRPPDANELGWKDTVRMHPLEDIVVALRPTTPPVPFPVPNSIRPLDVTMPLGTTAQFTGVDPYTDNPITVTEAAVNAVHGGGSGSSPFFVPERD